MNGNTIARCTAAATFVTVLLLAGAPASFAGSASSASGGVAKLDQPGSGYRGYSASMPTMKVLLPGRDYSTSYWAPDLALTWQPGE